MAFNFANFKLSTDIDNKIKYDITECEVTNLSCTILPNTINVISNNPLYTEQVSVYFPENTAVKCQDMILLVDQLANGLQIMNKTSANGNVTLWKDNAVASDDLAYRVDERSLYSFTELKKDVFSISKRNIEPWTM